jgi:hypothetical protein
MTVRRIVPVVLAALLLASGAWAQFGRGGNAAVTARMATPESYDGKFHYCRAAYRVNPRGDGGNWLTDYPNADIDLMIRLAELTRTPVGFDAARQPEHLIVRLTDQELFQCPFIMMQEVGSLFFSDEDAKTLRTYLLKGGFLWVDDFWGSYAWTAWAAQIRKVFPAAEYAIEDLGPDHPMLHSHFNLPGVPQIPSINHWYGSGGGTSERGFDSAEVHARTISDKAGRVMVLMTHNTDVSDSWEREGEDPQYFLKFSVPGYQVGINVLMYVMTH